MEKQLATHSVSVFHSARESPDKEINSYENMLLYIMLKLQLGTQILKYRVYVAALEEGGGPGAAKADCG